MEFLIGGVAACGAGLFTNPLEVAKTRMQLQGELARRCQYTIHYKNVLHAFYTIAKVDGLLALQKGLMPALWYQFVMNGIRLGAYQWLDSRGFTRDNQDRVSLPFAVAAGAITGCLGASAGSPFYMIKVQLQAMAKKEIAVGYQHQHNGMQAAFEIIYKQNGLRGLWRGVSSAVARVTVGSAAQLTTFSFCKEYIENFQMFSKDSWLNSVAASVVSGAVTVFFMTPFDVVSTRIYNQGTDASGRGLLYKNVLDCFLKTLQKEGIWGFYKGWGASMFRLGPHTVLSLVFWSQLQIGYGKLQKTLESI